MLLAAGTAEMLGTDDGPRLRFGEDAAAAAASPGRRALFLDGKAAFELSWWCGTCPFLFERLDGANDPLGLPALERRLGDGLGALDAEVIAAFSTLLPAGKYLPLLLEVQPRLVSPVLAGDYFAEEQVATWGISSFWGLPENPRTPYYRTFETAVDRDAHLYEFVVPMVPPSWNDSDRVKAFGGRLATTSLPTGVAVSLLDVCAPAVAGRSTDYYEHWGLTHFLLDGHHKFQAAAETGASLRLLSLLAIEEGLADASQVARIPKLRRQSGVARAALNREAAHDR